MGMEFNFDRVFVQLELGTDAFLIILLHIWYIEILVII
jgi:hypothetical protein